MPGAVCGKVGVEGNGRGGKLQAAVDHVGLACGGDETSGRFMPACMGRLEHDVEVHGRLDVLEERFGGHQADGCLEGDFSKGYASRETGDCANLCGKNARSAVKGTAFETDRFSVTGVP